MAFYGNLQATNKKEKYVKIHHLHVWLHRPDIFIYQIRQLRLIFPTSISKISICNNSSYPKDALKSSNIVWVVRKWQKSMVDVRETILLALRLGSFHEMLGHIITCNLMQSELKSRAVVLLDLSVGLAKYRELCSERKWQIKKTYRVILLDTFNGLLSWY